MKKKIRKVILMVLAISMLVTCSGYAFADLVAASSEKSPLSAALKEDLFRQISLTLMNGQAIIDSKYDGKLSIGEEIPAYIYENQQLVASENEFYPIVTENEVAYVAIKSSLDGTEFISLSQGFLPELTQSYKSGKSLALIYAADASYLISDSDIVELASYQSVAGRDSFESVSAVSQAISAQRISRSEIAAKEALGYVSSVGDDTRSASVQLIVPYVPQAIEINGVPVSSNICWAASVACIGNYVTGASNSATFVAEVAYYRDYYGPAYEVEVEDWNIGRNRDEAMDIMEYIYGFSYVNYGSASNSARDTWIYNSLSADYPVYSSWDYYAQPTDNDDEIIGGHSCVIRGIMTDECVFVMDPEYGFSVADEVNGRYAYISLFSDMHLRLNAIGF